MSPARGLLQLGVLLLTAAAASGSNPFTSTVVALTPKNFKQHVVNSPHVWFINVCRQS